MFDVDEFVSSIESWGWSLCPAGVERAMTGEAGWSEADWVLGGLVTAGFVSYENDVEFCCVDGARDGNLLGIVEQLAAEFMGLA